jgi:serine protease Do
MTSILICSALNSASSKPLPDSFAPLVEKLMPAVVNISTTQTIEGIPAPFEEFQFNLPPGSPFEGLPEMFEQFKKNEGSALEQKVASLGSGFIIDKAGFIVTNNHVVDKAEEITVILSDDTRLEARIVGRDPKTDVALLKVESDKPLPYVNWGNSDQSRVGDWVVAIGNPFGLGGSVSSGIISARARDINAGPFDDFLQTDAAINRGNSGGPLFNIEGDVIGVNTAIFSPSGGNVGIGFATPSELVKPVVEQLREHGRTFRGWLGVKIQIVTDDIAESLGLNKAHGALVVEVSLNSPAAKAGVKVGDVIIGFNGQLVPTMRKLPRMVAENKSGNTVEMVVWRDGKRNSLSVTLGELPSDDVKVATKEQKTDENQEDLSKTKEMLGMWLRPLSNQDKELLKLDRHQEGLLVVKTTKDGEAAKKGIMRGDIIISANQVDVTSFNELENSINKAKKSSRNAILLLIQRGGSTQFIALNLKD